MSLLFPFVPGQEVTKAAVHKALGGSDQHAMTSCLSRSAFLIFYDPKSGRKFGYDLWEGEQADGTISYTGQGVKGDQKMRGPNLGLIRAAQENAPIHFFRRPELGVKRVKGNPYTYVGRVLLGDPMFQVQVAPDEDGRNRKVFVFKLVPVGHADFVVTSLGDENGAIRCEFHESPELPEVAQPRGNLRLPTAIELEENKLQNRFRKFLADRGETPETVDIRLPNVKGSVRPDFVLRERGIVIEVKPTISREHVRLAIGQVLDYAHLLKLDGKNYSPAILLPAKPKADLISLTESVGIRLIVESPPSEFEFV
jgi:hypothetical protein